MQSTCGGVHYIWDLPLFQKWKCVKDKPAIKHAAQWKPAEDHYAGHQTPFVFVQWQFDRLLFFS